MNGTPPPLVMTIPEAAARLGVHRNTIAGLVRDGFLPVVKVGRLTKIRESDLVAYLDARTVWRTPPPTRDGAA